MDKKKQEEMDTFLKFKEALERSEGIQIVHYEHRDKPDFRCRVRSREEEYEVFIEVTSLYEADEKTVNWNRSSDKRDVCIEGEKVILAQNGLAALIKAKLSNKGVDEIKLEINFLKPFPFENKVSERRERFAKELTDFVKKLLTERNDKRFILRRNQLPPSIGKYVDHIWIEQSDKLDVSINPFISIEPPNILKEIVSEKDNKAKEYCYDRLCPLWLVIKNESYLSEDEIKKLADEKSIKSKCFDRVYVLYRMENYEAFKVFDKEDG